MIRIWEDHKIIGKRQTLIENTKKKKKKAKDITQVFGRVSVGGSQKNLSSLSEHSRVWEAGEGRRARKGEGEREPYERMRTQE